MRPQDRREDRLLGRQHVPGVRRGGWLLSRSIRGAANPPSVLSKQVSAGDYHTCSLQLDGYVDCWGMESDGSMDSIGPNSWVAAAYWHTCAIRVSDGEAECWGDNAVLGKMAQPPAGQKFTKLATGENHACGITPEGAVKCWGGNTWGQAPEFRAGPYKEIAAGDLFTCGLKATGEIDCWGYNFYGQTNAPDGLWTTLGVGDSFACASNTTTNVWQCWGWNLYGNAPHNKDLPPQQPGPDTDTPVVQIVLTPAEPDGANGWYRNPVKVDPQASDGSGIEELRCMLDPPYVPASFDTLSSEPCAFLGGKVVGGEGEHTFYAAAKDPWGNVSAVASVSFKFDLTPPKLICPKVQPFLLGSGPYQVGISVSDFVSGVDTAHSTLFGRVATDTVGPKSATFTALDVRRQLRHQGMHLQRDLRLRRVLPAGQPRAGGKCGQGWQRDPAQVQPGGRPGTGSHPRRLPGLRIAGLQDHGSGRRPAGDQVSRRDRVDL